MKAASTAPSPLRAEIHSLNMNWRLTEAFEAMQRYIAESEGNTWSFQEELAEYVRSYSCMKEVLLNGVEDSQRDRLYCELLAKMECLADQVEMQNLCLESDDWYHALRRSWLKSAGKSLGSYLPMLQDYADNRAIAQALPDGGKSLLALQKNYYTQLDSLFLTILTNIHWSHEDWSAAQEMLQDEAVPPQAVCLTASAVTLSLQKCFDPFKLQWLLKACHHSSQAVCVRALVGLIMETSQYRSLVKFYPGWKQAIEEMYHSSPLKQLFEEICLQLIRSQQTETICKHIRKEIIPDIIQKRGLFTSSKLYDIMQEEETDDINPDWKATEAFERKIEEIAKMQQEGLDIQYTSFSAAKHLSFFVKEMAHWFLPFDPRHPELDDLLDSGKPTPQQKPLLQVLQTGNLCSSDCYSLCFLLRGMSKELQQQMFSRMMPPDMQEMLGDDFSPVHIEETPRQTIKLYMQDLYRFYHLQAHGREFFNIFETDSLTMPSGLILFDDPSFLRAQADLWLSFGKYAIALYPYTEIETNHPSYRTAELFQQIGYCHEKTREYEKALTYYDKADEVKPDTPWTLRHMACCLRILKRFDQAIRCYERLEKLRPDDTSVLYLKACTLTDSERYDEALKLFYKLDYLQPDTPKVWRGIVWCSLVLRHLEQAEKYNLRLLEAGREANDLMNMGNLCVLRKDYRQACQYYGEGWQLYPPSDRAGKLSDELNVLAKMGCPEHDLHIIYDIVCSQHPLTPHTPC